MKHEWVKIIGMSRKGGKGGSKGRIAGFMAHRDLSTKGKDSSCPQLPGWEPRFPLIHDCVDLPFYLSFYFLPREALFLLTSSPPIFSPWRSCSQRTSLLLCISSRSAWLWMVWAPAFSRPWRWTYCAVRQAPPIWCVSEWCKGYLERNLGVFKAFWGGHLSKYYRLHSNRTIISGGLYDKFNSFLTIYHRKNRPFSEIRQRR